MDYRDVIKRYDEGQEIFRRPSIKELLVYIEYIEARSAELERALRLAVEWLDEVTNPDNADLRTDEGIAVRQEIQKALGENG